MTDDIPGMTYEAAVAELEKTVQRLGRDQEDLAESVRQFERGLALAKHCSELLRDAERRLAEASPPPPGAAPP